MGNTCKSMADSCQCMQKTLQYCKEISLQLIKIIGGGGQRPKWKDLRGVDLYKINWFRDVVCFQLIQLVL